MLKDEVLDGLILGGILGFEFWMMFEWIGTSILMACYWFGWDGFMFRV
jgi:hypothetical protein